MGDRFNSGCGCTGEGLSFWVTHRDNSNLGEEHKTARHFGLEGMIYTKFFNYNSKKIMGTVFYAFFNFKISPF